MTAVAPARGDGSGEPTPGAKTSDGTEPRTTEGSPTASPAEAQPAVADHAPDSEPSRPAAAGRSTEPDGFEAAGALPQVLKVVGAVVAPSSLLTALLFYFGLLYAVGFFRYFGVNFTVLDLPVQDYLILSVSSSIIPLIYVAIAGLLALWLYQLPLASASDDVRRVLLRVVPPAVAVAGSALVGLALVDATVGLAVFPATFLEARGLSLAIGVLLLAYAARLRRLARPVSARRRVPEAMVVAKWGAVFILVSVGLFWAVGSYAVGVGERNAAGFAANFSSLADVAVYSEKSLSLRAPGVREVTCRDPDAAYRFRYDGLKVVPQSGNQYLLLPAGWTRGKGAAILLPRSEALRLEFSWSGGAQGPAC